MNKRLEESVQECVRCLYKNTHPFGLSFNKDGVCSGCQTHDEKFTLDWDERFSRLERIASQLRHINRNSDYDCVVPVRGTPEYFYVLDVLKNKLGLRPLIVCYNSQFNSYVGIQNLDQLREIFDVDLLHYTTNPNIYKKLIREALVRFKSMRWPYISGETSFPVQIAVEHKVSCVIWPYHQPTEQVGMHSYLDEPMMSRRSRHEFDLMGYEPSQLISAETLINSNDIHDIQYPSNRELERGQIVGIYLANYLPWDTRRYSESMIEKYGARGAVNPRTFDTYDRIDDMTYMTIHDVLKQAKLGYSRVTDNLCREIRFGRISRESAVAIEKHYQAQYPDVGIDKFLSWIGMERNGFLWVLERMPYEVTHNINVNSLSLDQKNFSAYFLGHENKVICGDFIVYGKGLPTP